ncbi:MAG: DUF4344 domain-containing metallopeptidase [Candidatus Devosia phytovorans]|uniref:DUF4344 domain-containing metallopeptidase n=1 Tax=Candidatus Devosia phytovorans TaxID=3121372 RepID=A0AAJ5W053_9HYPH|nr:DUF4344 domain-containing metallopeptidase [Devosia sp.]WEK06587.1 MAG: DUF4344 domain-containing metallopeptidase [Devosia sp.]
MSLFRKLFFGLAIGLPLLATGAQALEMTKQQRAEQRRFSYNNSLFVLYHEVGHLLFHQLDLPILGREEDAADNFASWTLLRQGTDVAKQVMEDASHGWLLSGVAYNSGGDESDFAAAHSLDKQRAYQIVCLAIGMDEDAFRPIANEYRIDRDRQESCAWDYDMVDRSLDNVLAGSGSKKGMGTEVVVTYHHVGGRLKAAADAFRSSGVFDQVADELRTRYRLRETVRFNAQRCGEANAFYDPDTVEVIFCYELMQDYMDLYADDLAEEIANSPAGKQKVR